ncbi:hypothetical protein PS2_000336 [Malus domestica]
MIATLGTSPTGLSIDTSLDGYKFDSNLKTIFEERVVAFLFYWYNKYFFCAKSNKCLAENMPVADALASGHILAHSPAVLANLIRCLAEATLGKIDPHQHSPL